MIAEAVLLPRGPDAVKLLLDRIPEFKEHLDRSDLDLPYVAFEFFAQYLRNLPPDVPVSKRAFDFLNELAESGDDDLKNLLQISVFEHFAADEQSTRMIKPRLGDQAMRLFAAAENTLRKV